jgi:hypothetical protein
MREGAPSNTRVVLTALTLRCCGSERTFWILVNGVMRLGSFDSKLCEADVSNDSVEMQRRVMCLL